MRGGMDPEMGVVDAGKGDTDHDGAAGGHKGDRVSSVARESSEAGDERRNGP